MAYDRYDTRRDPRDRWRSDEFRGRERGHGDRDERGFLERAGDEIASWFGDDDRDRRRHEEHGRGRDWDRERDSRRGFDQPRSRGDWDRDDDDRGSASSRRGFGGEGREDDGRMGSTPRSLEDRGHRPMAGDYGRAGFDRDRGRSQWDRDDYRRTSFAGSMDRSNHPDPHYSEWRKRQIEDLDRDYDEYRREHQSKFESDFGDWRTRRQGKRQMLVQVREHMEVVGSDDEHIGTVDRVAGDRIILTKSDPEAGGVHHSIPCTLIERIEEQKIFLDCPAEKARERWRDESRERALFEREDQGEAGPGILDRSFSGTYR